MTTKPILAAAAVISSAVLVFGPTAHAHGPNLLNYPPELSTVNQISVPVPEPPTPVKIPVLESLPELKAAAPEMNTNKLPEPIAIAAEAQIPVASNPTSPTYRSGSTSGNTYYWGQCTWYAKNKRPDLPNGLGNGGQWVKNAAARGFSTGTTPRAGAIGEQPGHVVYVDSVNSDGTVNISEMNYNGGVGVVHTRTVAASTFTYIY